MKEPVYVVAGDGPETKDNTIYPDTARRVVGIHRIRRRRRDVIGSALLQRAGSERLKKPDEFRVWGKEAAKQLIRRIERNKEPKDVVVTFGQPMSCHVAGLTVKQALGLPWIAHFSDPWVGNIFRNDRAETRLVNEVLERNVIERSDRVVFTCEEARDLLFSKYPQSWMTKARVIPHSFDPSLYSASPSQGIGLLCIRCVGNFYGLRTPEPLFEALHRVLCQQPKLADRMVVELVGNVPKEMLDRGTFRALPKGLVRLIGPVSYMESLQLMRTSDLLMILDAPNELSPFLPSKLVDYIGANRPLIGITPAGAAKNLIKRIGGWVADPSKVDEIADLLIAVANRQAPEVCPENAPIRLTYLASRVAAQMDCLIREVRSYATEPKKARHQIEGVCL